MNNNQKVHDDRNNHYNPGNSILREQLYETSIRRIQDVGTVVEKFGWQHMLTSLKMLIFKQKGM